VKWQFHQSPLGFSGAIRAGLREVRFDWVYLLNSDVVLDPNALEAAARCRDGGIFAVASQIVFKDSTRYRDETNWTELFIEDGLVTIHDCIPQSGEVVDSFYAGGAASLFQTRLLRPLADMQAYDPFYWEDVEWGWRARKLGYRNVFCPASVAHHSRRSTISRHYSADEVETVLQRNRLLFQLRNLTRAGSLDRVFDQIAHAPPPVRRHFADRRVMWDIARGRMWNHLAPLADERILRRATYTAILKSDEAASSPA
jgi:GT2 family glycosyltransferase